jgi:hypothetical protein
MNAVKIASWSDRSDHQAVDAHLAGVPYGGVMAP